MGRAATAAGSLTAEQEELVARVRRGPVLEAVHAATGARRLVPPERLGPAVADDDAFVRLLLATGDAAPHLGAARSRSRHPRRRGLRVAQLAVRGTVDAGLSQAGSHDGGGIVTLVVQLAQALAARPEVERVVTIARGHGSDVLGPSSLVERLPIGQPGAHLRDLWELAPRLEAELAARLRLLRPDVLHLRFADIATLAGARAARRLGIPVIFTLAPDPHVLLDAFEARGLTRADFVALDRSERYLLRVGLVDALIDESAALVELPRRGGREELERLLGRSLSGRPVYTVPEGIDVAVSRTARAEVVGGHDAGAVADLIAALPPERRGLPLIVSVGRLDPVKGFPRLVSAWAADPELRAAYNLVVIGGDLRHPSAVEAEQLAQIDAALPAGAAARAGLVLLGHRSHADVARVLAIAAVGRPGAVAPHGIYACASAKEEFGVALLEALAAGLVVVAPADGGPPSYVEDGRTGVLVPAGQPSELRAGLHAAGPLRTDALRARRARRLVARQYAIESMAAGLVEVYRDVTRAPAAA